VADHFRHFGEPSSIVQLKRDGAIYYELSGRMYSFPVLVFPSSPPVYIYDESGKFVEWCSDPGDQIEFRERWLRIDARPIVISSFRHKYGL
jgi:hypothetical protein